MIIRYWTRAWSRDKETHVFEDYTKKVEFKDDGVHYSWFGMRKVVAYEKVISIREEGEK